MRPQGRSVLSLFLVLIVTTPSAADLVRLASHEVRVGHYDTALEVLASIRTDRKDASAIALVKARAYLMKGDDAECLQELKKVKSPHFRDVKTWLYLKHAERFLDAKMIRQWSHEVRQRSRIPSILRMEADVAWAQASLTLELDSQLALRVLRRVSKKARDRSLRSTSLGILADTGDDDALRALTLEYPASAAARARQNDVLSLSLNTAQRVRRSEALFRLRAYDQAQVELSKLLEEDDDSIRQRAALLLGIVRYRMRDDYAQSERWFSQAVNGPDPKTALDARYRKAIALGYLKRYREGSTLMRRVAEEAKGRKKRSATYQVGRLLHEAGDYPGAIKAHTVFVESRPAKETTWRWFLGWAYDRNNQCVEARRVYRALSAEKNLLVGAKALYWTARCAMRQQDSAAIESALESLSERAPLSYYGFLGRQLSGAPVPRRIERQDVPIDYPLGPWSRSVKKNVKDELTAIAELARTGFIDFARIRFDKRFQRRLRRSLPRSKRKRAMGQLNRLLERWGSIWGDQSRRVKRLPWNEGLAQRARKDIVGAYPPAYLDLARAAGREYNISPYWLLAHMLQESRYKERAQSHAVAMGTMQILPRTGRRIAEKILFPDGHFFDSQLFRPGTALRQAAWYLDALRHEYDGNMILAMAAYNGGPRRISDHLRNVSALPFDMAIEEIGAHESRNYARKVADHLIRYVEIYGTERERGEILEALRPADPLPTPRGSIRF